MVSFRDIMCSMWQKKIYDNNLMNNEKSHNLLYDNLIKLVDPNYMRVDFDCPKINADT